MADYQEIQGSNTEYLRRTADGAYVAKVDPALAEWMTSNTPDPADPPPIVYGRTVSIGEHRVQTIGATSAELLRASVPMMTGYQAKLRLTAVADNLALRSIEAIVVVARGGGANAVIIQNAAGQNQSILADHRSGVGGSWAIVPTVQGADYVITVTGSADRTVDWRLTGQVESFSPGGEP